jgi:putative transcriptional regulator
MPKKLTITNNIRSLRFNSNEMTQNDLANKVGVTRQTIVAIEKAKYYQTLELAFLIARVFNKKVSEVFEVKFND